MQASCATWAPRAWRCCSSCCRSWEGCRRGSTCWHTLQETPPAACSRRCRQTCKRRWCAHWQLATACSLSRLFLVCFAGSACAGHPACIAWCRWPNSQHSAPLTSKPPPLLPVCRENSQSCRAAPLQPGLRLCTTCMQVRALSTAAPACRCLCYIPARTLPFSAVCIRGGLV